MSQALCDEMVGLFLFFYVFKNILFNKKDREMGKTIFTYWNFFDDKFQHFDNIKQVWWDNSIRSEIVIFVLTGTNEYILKEEKFGWIFTTVEN